jgi:hypothetical protein
MLTVKVVLYKPVDQRITTQTACVLSLRFAKYFNGTQKPDRKTYAIIISTTKSL